LEISTTAGEARCPVERSGAVGHLDASEYRQARDLAKTISGIAGLPAAIAVTYAVLESLFESADMAAAVTAIERIKGQLDELKARKLSTNLPTH
jgi:hypothetical protein